MKNDKPEETYEQMCQRNLDRVESAIKVREADIEKAKGDPKQDIQLKALRDELAGWQKDLENPPGGKNFAPKNKKKAVA